MRYFVLIPLIILSLTVILVDCRPHRSVVDGPLARPHLSSPPTIIRGVNLGGWLVLEPWITPSLFEPWINSSNPAVDEWTFSQLLGPVEARRQLEKHWDQWLQYDHLTSLHNAGITHVRIPVGYWIISREPWEPYVDGGWSYLIRALEWCKDIGLRVLIDIHGLPGSQNGFDNSGRRGDIHWSDKPGTNILRSYYILANLTSELAPWSVGQGGPIHGIELVNEPFATIELEIVQQYYTNGYQIIRSAGEITDPAANFDCFIHDSFRMGAWTNFLQPPAYQNVYLDTHVYHVFDNGLLHMNESEHIDFTCSNIAQQEAKASQSLWLVTGEWSLATTDCAQWLNGFLRGSRWAGTLDPSQPAIGNCTGNFGNEFKDFTPEYIQFLRTFAETQMDVYENAGSGSAGWYFWNFRTEGSPQWDFLFGLKHGFIPNPVTNRTYTCAPKTNPSQSIEKE